MKTVSSKLAPLSIALCLIAAAPAQQARAQTVSNETVHAVLDQGRLRLSWDAADGKLQEALTPTGIWQTVTTAVSPYRVPTVAAKKFYRLIRPPPGKKWLTVAAVTMRVQTNTEANLQTMYSYMELAASNRADLVVFPEIALQQCPAWGASHEPTAPEMAYVRQTAETIPGPSTSNLLAKAKALGLYVVFGLTEKDEAGLLYNANVFLGPEGLLGKHRKRYLYDSSWGGNEDQIWRPGQAWDVIDSPIGKVGLLICLEMVYYPGSALAKQGADLLVTSSAWSSSYGSDYDNGTIGNALQAHRWHVISDQVGSNGHGQSYGHSRVVDPGGKIACDTGAREGMVVWATDIMIEVRPR